MKTTIAISIGIFLVIAFSCLHAQPAQNETAVETQQAAPQRPRITPRPRAKLDFVKVIDCHLRDGKLIFGKLLSEEKNKITLEQLEEGRITVSTYSKRVIDTRTMHTKNIPEYQYYLDLAEYFSGRTWDFVDDPDDFIQAIRCYEKAKQLVEQSQRQDDEKIKQIQTKIKRLQADRDVWIRETASRAQLKKLEFEAEIDARIDEFEDKIDASSKQLEESMKHLDDIAADIDGNYKRLENIISERDADLTRQLDILRQRTELNRSLIDRWWWMHPQPYLPGSGTGGTP